MARTAEPRAEAVTSGPAYREKLRSLSLNARPTRQKVTTDHTDTAVVHTTTKDNSQDVRVVMNDCVRPHWKEPRDG